LKTKGWGVYSPRLAMTVLDDPERRGYEEEGEQEK
jgi:hypothetical protein